jgi:hypothetical protein
MNFAFVLLAATLGSARPSLTIVSYRIAAPPNAVIRYGGEDYKTGSTGSIELINDGQTTTVSVGDSVFNLPLSGPTDDFGSVTISVMPESEGSRPVMLKRGARTKAAR